MNAKPSSLAELTKAWLGLLQVDQVDGAVPGVNRQQVAAAVELTLDVLAAQPPTNRHRHVKRDVTVPPVELDNGRKSIGQMQGYAAVSGMQDPTLRDERTRKDSRFHSPIPGADVKAIETAPVALICPSPACARSVPSTD